MDNNNLINKIRDFVTNKSLAIVISSCLGITLLATGFNIAITAVNTNRINQSGQLSTSGAMPLNSLGESIYAASAGYFKDNKAVNSSALADLVIKEINSYLPEGSPLSQEEEMLIRDNIQDIIIPHTKDGSKLSRKEAKALAGNIASDTQYLVKNFTDVRDIYQTLMNNAPMYNELESQISDIKESIAYANGEQKPDAPAEQKAAANNNTSSSQTTKQGSTNASSSNKGQNNEQGQASSNTPVSGSVEESASIKGSSSSGSQNQEYAELLNKYEQLQTNFATYKTEQEALYQKIDSAVSNVNQKVEDVDVEVSGVGNTVKNIQSSVGIQELGAAQVSSSVKNISDIQYHPYMLELCGPVGNNVVGIIDDVNKMIGYLHNDNLKNLEQTKAVEETLLVGVQQLKQYVNSNDDILLHDFQQNRKEIEKTIADNYSEMYNKVNDINKTATNKINNLQKDTDARLNSLESNTGDQINNLEDNTNEKLNNLETNTNEKLNNLENNTNEKLDNLENNTNEKIDNLENNITNRVDNLEQDINERVTEAENSINERISMEVDEINEVIVDNYNELRDLMSEDSANLNQLVATEVQNLKQAIKELEASAKQAIKDINEQIGNEERLANEEANNDQNDAAQALYNSNFDKTYKRQINNITDEINSIYEDMQYLAVSVALKYKEGGDYPKGNYVLYNNKLYKVIEDVENAPEAIGEDEFSQNHFERTSIGLELSKINHQISNLLGDLGGLKFEYMTKEEHDALPDPDDDTVYLVY